MRAVLPDNLEDARTGIGHRFHTARGSGPTGFYKIRGPQGDELTIAASAPSEGDQNLSQGWEHVSVSKVRNCPSWPEMCWVKNLFWTPEETVVQYHPPESEYVNNHPRTLHLFRHIFTPFPMPPSYLVGIKGISNVTYEEAQIIGARIRAELEGKD